MSLGIILLLSSFSRIVVAGADKMDGGLFKEIMTEDSPNLCIQGQNIHNHSTNNPQIRLDVKKHLTGAL